MQVDIWDVEYIHEQETYILGGITSPRVGGNRDVKWEKKVVCYIMEKHRNGVRREHDAWSAIPQIGKQDLMKINEFSPKLAGSSVGFVLGTQGQGLNITMMWEYSKAGWLQPEWKDECQNAETSGLAGIH